MRIGVLFHEAATSASGYLVEHLAEFWREDGHSVEFVFGPRGDARFDILLVHVDLSVVPQEYIDYASTQPLALNCRIQDIRKSRISRNLVRPRGSWKGPVIAKTDLNYGGLPEEELRIHRLDRHTPYRLRKHLRELEKKLRPGRYLEQEGYRIFDTPAAIPWSWRLNKRIVFERFLPEFEHGHYNVRFCMFLGDVVRCVLLKSREPVVTTMNCVSAEDVEPHLEVLEWRRELGLDYGKLDYVLHEGEPVLIDVNKTIGSSRGYRSEQELRAGRRRLADGLYSFLA
jgi:hypothetical protein